MAKSKKKSDPFQWTVDTLMNCSNAVSSLDLNDNPVYQFQIAETMRITGGDTPSVIINAPLIIDNMDVAATLKDVMSVLGVISRDIAREDKYKGLRQAADQYQQQLDKYKTFETIKDSQ